MSLPWTADFLKPPLPRVMGAGPRPDSSLSVSLWVCPFGRRTGAPRTPPKRWNSSVFYTINHFVKSPSPRVWRNRCLGTHFWSCGICKRGNSSVFYTINQHCPFAWHCRKRLKTRRFHGFMGNPIKTRRFQLVLDLFLQQFWSGRRAFYHSKTKPKRRVGKLGGRACRKPL